MNATDNGDYFPIWGTCLGFELLHYIISGEHSDVLGHITEEEMVARKVNYIDNV